MTKQTKADVESLVKQMRLIEPPESLDQKIAQLAGSHHDQVVVSNRGVHWSPLIATALAASLFGLIIGVSYSNSDAKVSLVEQLPITQAVQMEEMALFQDLHGHSSNGAFKECSDCHKFANKQEQVVKQWNFDHSHKHLQQKCSNCHTSATEPAGFNPHTNVPTTQSWFGLIKNWIFNWFLRA